MRDLERKLGDVLYENAQLRKQIERVELLFDQQRDRHEQLANLASSLIDVGTNAIWEQSRSSKALTLTQMISVARGEQ